jgi:hypothetical protein
MVAQIIYATSPLTHPLAWRGQKESDMCFFKFGVLLVNLLNPNDRHQLLPLPFLFHNEHDDQYNFDQACANEFNQSKPTAMVAGISTATDRKCYSRFEANGIAFQGYFLPFTGSANFSQPGKPVFSDLLPAKNPQI